MIDGKKVPQSSEVELSGCSTLPGFLCRPGPGYFFLIVIQCP
jgi:hypothetical protein